MNLGFMLFPAVCSPVQHRFPNYNCLGSISTSSTAKADIIDYHQVMEMTVIATATGYPPWNNLQRPRQINSFPDISLRPARFHGCVAAKEERQRRNGQREWGSVVVGEGGMEEKQKRQKGRGSLNWESITEAWPEQPFSVSGKHTEMCSSAEAL